MNDELLLTRVSYLTHVLDKRSSTGVMTPEELLASFGTELRRLLDQLDSQGHGLDPRVAWASQVLADLQEKGEVTAVPPCQTLCFDVLSVVRERRSVRRWSGREVTHDEIELLLEAARWAPSSCNRQATRLIVLRSDRLKRVVARLNESWLEKAPMLILVGVDLRMYKPLEQKGGAPYLDAAAAIQNMLLVGHSVGLGCLWAKASVEEWGTKPKVYFDAKKTLHLPSFFRPISLVGVGWPAGNPRTPPRRGIGEFVRFEDAGFESDDFPEWKPQYSRLFLSRWTHRILRVGKIFGRKRQRKEQCICR